MKIKALIALGFAVFVSAWWGLSVYPDWLWFGKLGYSSVFWTMLLSKFAIGVIAWFVLVLIVFANLAVASRLGKDSVAGSGADTSETFLSQFGLSGRAGTFLLVGLVLFVGVFMATRSSSQWDMVLRYLHRHPFGVNDPIYHKDAGFYVFSLPFYLFIQSSLLLYMVLAAVFTILWQLKSGGIQLINMARFVQGEDASPAAVPKITATKSAKGHLIFLGGIFVLILAWGYRLKMFSLLYSTHAAAFGAGYTDVHVRIPGYAILAVLCLAFAGLLFVHAFQPKRKLVLLGGGIWLAAIFVFSTLLPLAVQKFMVKPNELAKESPYIGYNIEFTNRAYNLDKIKEVSFAVNENLTMADIKAEKGTIQNIRIWDKRPLLQTYRQLQSIRLYYDFKDVDVDRYTINGEYRQIMLSAREFIRSQLPPQANTWVNAHLIYTHGYGLAASPVSEVTTEGLPRLIIKDLPPVVDADIQIDRPQIYYGEKTDDYVFVNTNTKEFDYPKGEKNVYTHYQGTGGVPIRTFLRRLLFSLEFSDAQILFTNYLGKNSRIMYNRRIDKRVRAIAPFLRYDGDPYLVISRGGLYWIFDAYTTSNMYPYSIRSRPYPNSQLNYIRNSVKVVIDAYNGDVTYYVIDEKDPIIKTYADIFPKLFKSFKEMPDDLSVHIRYPKDLFKIQADIYRTYHMKDVQVFYNQEDLWQIPDEIYGSSPQRMEPYHVILRLPEEPREEFVLMFPFTPSKKDNMIAWLAARCDLANYGRLIVYKLPKEKLVFGPMQIEARVDQQTHISRELTLWGQRGSTVIRGNLLAIPTRKTFIYVEPIYLVAKQSESRPAQVQPSGGQKRTRMQRAGTSRRVSGTRQQGSAALPELKRVIVAFGNRLMMKKNLKQALFGLLGEKVTPEKPPALPSLQPAVVGDLGARALEHYRKAQDYLRQGDWAGYGKEQRLLEEVLKQMAEKKTRKEGGQ